MPKYQNTRNFKIPINWIFHAIIIIGLIALYYGLFPRMTAEPVYDIPYSVFKELVYDGQTESVLFKGQDIEGELFQPTCIGPQGEMANRF